MPFDEVEVQEIPVAVALKPMSFAESLIKSNQVAVTVQEPSKYIDLKWIIGTSNMVERLFSLAKQFLTYDRASMTPEHLEMQLYLFVNKRYWSKWTVNKVYQAEL